MTDWLRVEAEKIAENPKANPADIGRAIVFGLLIVADEVAKAASDARQRALAQATAKLYEVCPVCEGKCLTGEVASCVTCNNKGGVSYPPGET